MSGEGESKTCHVCHEAEALSNDVVCEACQNYLNPETHYGRWDVPSPAKSPDQAGGDEIKLTEANLKKFLETSQTRTDTIRRQHRAALRASYRQMLQERQIIYGDTREQALTYAQGAHEDDDVLASVAVSEELEQQDYIREDIRSQTALRYRQLLRNRMEINRELRDEAVAWTQQQMQGEVDLSSVAASEEEEFQDDISTNRETLSEAYRRLLRNYTRGNRHTREESLELGRLQLGHHADFAAVVEMEEDDYQDYLRDEERSSLRRRYRDELRDRVLRHNESREEALAWLQQNMGGHIDFAEVARSEVDDYEGQMRVENANHSDVGDSEFTTD